MSDAKPKRLTRESERNDGFAGGISPAGPAPDIAPAAAAQALPETEPSPLPAVLIEPAVSRVDNPWSAVAEMQAALARGFEEAAAEMTALARSGIAAAGDAGIALLAVHTLTEAVEINAGLLQRRSDAIFAGSIKLSAIGAKTATEASRAILAPLCALWGGADFR